MNDWPQMLEKAEAACRTVAEADLAGRGVYLMRRSELSADLGGDCVFCGIVWQDIDLHLRKHLGSRWTGRGFATILHDAMIGDACGDGDAQQSVTGLAIHELAHVLDRGWHLRWDEPHHSHLTLQESAKIHAGEIVEDIRADLKDEVFCIGHEPHGYGRTVCHLVYRLVEATGFYLSPRDVWTFTGPRSASSYYRALQPEMKAMAGKPFAEVLAADPPAEFVKLCGEFDRWKAEKFGQNP